MRLHGNNPAHDIVFHPEYRSTIALDWVRSSKGGANLQNSSVQRQKKEARGWDLRQTW